ncbi:MAG: hypothetical protein U1E53_30995 [Dongiaceae bacterium]
MAVADLEREVLGHLPAVEYRLDGQLISAVPTQALAPHLSLDADELALQATSSALRLRARSSARLGLRQTRPAARRGSPGWWISASPARRRADSCSGPVVGCQRPIAGARKHADPVETRRREILANPAPR